MIKHVVTLGLMMGFLWLANAEVKMLKMDFSGNLAISGLDRDLSATSRQPVEFAPNGGVVIGSENCLKVPHLGRLNPEHGTLEISITPLDWAGNSKDFQFFFHCRNSEDSSIAMLEKTPDGNIIFLIGFLKKFSKVSMPVNDWKQGEKHLVKAVWTSDKLEIYQDGKLCSSAPRHSYEPLKFDGNIDIGGKVFAPCHGKSAIDSFLLYSGIPSATDKTPVINKVKKESEISQSRNIATKKFRAVILPSSQWQKDHSLSIEQAMDGNFDSYYLSGKNDGVHWIEIRWPQPILADGVQVSFRTPYSSKAYQVKYFDKGEWKELISVKDNLNALHDFQPINSDKIRLYFDDEPDRQIALNEVQITGNAPESFLKSPCWNAFFIWYPEPTVNNAVRYFRRNFQVENRTAIKKAMLQICADDAYTVYINGNLVGTGGFQPEIYDVTSLLKPGRNSVAILVREFSICEGVLAELTLIDSLDEIKRINTDLTWLASNELIKDWNKSDFDDRKWVHAVRSSNLGDYASNIKYRHFSSNENDFDLKQLTPEKTVVRPGEAFELRATLSCRKNIKQDYGFKVIIGEEALNATSEYTVLTADLQPDLPTSKWQPGKTYELVWKMQMPNWAPHGKIPIQFNAINSNGEIVIASKQNNIEIIRFDNPPPRRNKPIHAAVVSTDGQPHLEINGKRMPPVIFCLNSYNNTFRELGEHSSIQTGLYRYVMLGTNLYPPKEADPEKFFSRTMAVIDQDINNMLRLYPNAYILFSLSFRPEAAWSEEWPDETVHMSDGSHIKHSFSSEVWLKMSNDAASRIITHLRKSDYAGHIAGIHFSIGEGAEAMHWGHRTNGFTTPREKVIAGDFSPPAMKKFRNYLQRIYNNDINALRSAWKKPQIDFESAGVDIAELRREDQQNFRDPSKGRMFMDYWNFHASSVAEAAVTLAENIKNACNNEWLVGLWGFYNLAQLHLIYSPASSHIVAYSGIDKVLRSPAIDYLACIQSYAGVNARTPVITGMPDASFKLHNKIYLEEFDIRTFFTDLTFSHSHTSSQNETQNIIKRDFGESIVRNNLCWFCGFARGLEGRRSIGWYSEDSLIKLLNQCAKIGESVQAYSNKSNAEVALFVNARDISSMDIMDAPGTLTNTQYNTVFQQLRKIATPYDCYFLDDFSEKLLKQYKVVIMLNAFYIPSDDRIRIRKTLEAQGKTVVWLYAPGYSDPQEGLSVNNILDLTGIKVGMTPEFREKLDVEVRGDNVYAAGISGHRFGPYCYAHDRRKQQIGPVFHVDDLEAKIFGFYVHNAKPALAIKKIGNMTSIYCAVPIISYELLKNIFHEAGVHFYTDFPVYLNASSRFITVHSREAVKTDIKLTENLWALDLFNNKIVAQNQSSFFLNAAAGTSNLYFIGKESEIREILKNLQSTK